MFENFSEWHVLVWIFNIKISNVLIVFESIHNNMLPSLFVYQKASTIWLKIWRIQVPNSWYTTHFSHVTSRRSLFTGHCSFLSFPRRFHTSRLPKICCGTWSMLVSNSICRPSFRATVVTYLTIFKRHVPTNLKAYILDTTMSWGSLQLVVPNILTSSPFMPLG